MNHKSTSNIQNGNGGGLLKSPRKEIRDNDNDSDGSNKNTKIESAPTAKESKYSILKDTIVLVKMEKEDESTFKTNLKKQTPMNENWNESNNRRPITKLYKDEITDKNSKIKILDEDEHGL